MKIIYSRAAQGRRRQFQIVTQIVLEEGKRYVIKEAACAEAKKHVENTFHNETVISAVYGEHLLRGQWVEGHVLTPYIEGETLGSRLRRYLDEERDEQKARILLRQWKELLIGDEKNICKFVPSKEFEAVFGGADDLEGIEATAVSNFDCSAENIFFLQEGGIKIIDYEWVFQFPIPVEMSFYRVLKTFFECNRGLVDWKKLLELSGLNGECSQRYDRMVDAFAKYTSVDRERGIDYALMGKKFKSGKMLEGKQEAFLYRFPYGLIPEESHIVLYGAGSVGEDFHRLIKTTNYCQLAAWTDKNAGLYRRQGLPVSDMEEIQGISYDYILIAVYLEEVAEEIRGELEAYGIDSDKIVWGKPQLL